MAAHLLFGVPRKHKHGHCLGHKCSLITFRIPPEQQNYKFSPIIHPRRIIFIDALIHLTCDGVIYFIVPPDLRGLSRTADSLGSCVSLHVTLEIDGSVDLRYGTNRFVIIGPIMLHVAVCLRVIDGFCFASCSELMCPNQAEDDN